MVLTIKRAAVTALCDTRQPDFRVILFSEVQACKNSSVALNILLLEIVKESAALTYHLKQTTTGVVILLVHLEVLVEVIDACRQKRNLHLGRTRIAFVELTLLDNL